MRADLATDALGAQVMIDWYRKRAIRWLPRRVEPWARRMGVAGAAIDVRDLGYRWGSMGKGDRIHFHWAT
jgi:predicted metal-dependent hydrolase